MVLHKDQKLWFHYFSLIIELEYNIPVYIYILQIENSRVPHYLGLCGAFGSAPRAPFASTVCVDPPASPPMLPMPPALPARHQVNW